MSSQSVYHISMLVSAASFGQGVPMVLTTGGGNDIAAVAVLVDKNNWFNRNG
jgi:hypothetical protein